MRYAIFVLLGGVLACLSYEALADSPAPPKPYKTVVGEYVFVMLPGYCQQDTPQEVEMTEAEFTAFRAKSRKEQPASPREAELRRQILEAELREKQLASQEAKLREEQPVGKSKDIRPIPPEMLEAVFHRQILEAELHEEQLALQQIPRSDPCAHYRARGGFSASGGGEKWRIRIDSYKWTITKHLQSEFGQDYPASGLYSNDGSTTPLWTVEWYAFETFLSRDARYLIRMGPWPGDYNELAVAFYDRGQLIKEYTIKELVRQPERLPHSVSHFRWRQGNVLLDDKTQTFTLRTLHDELYVFDIASGAIIRSEQATMPKVTAKVQYASGSVQTLSNFTACGALAHIAQMEEGQSALLKLYGILEESNSSQKGGKRQKEGKQFQVSIPFQEIRTVTQVGPNQKEQLRWHVLLKSGKGLTIAVHTELYAYCGEMLSGETVRVPTRDIKKIMLP